MSLRVTVEPKRPLNTNLLWIDQQADACILLSGNKAMSASIEMPTVVANVFQYVMVVYAPRAAILDPK